MKELDRIIKDITETIDKALLEFNKGANVSQQRLYDKIEELLNEKLDVKNGQIKVSAANYKAITLLKNDILATILDEDYLKSLAEFIQAHDKIAALVEKYIAALAPKGSLVKASKDFKNLLIETTLNSLGEAGIGLNIYDPIKDLLTSNITTGGMYKDLTASLRSSILGTDESDGSLVRYVKQIAADAINQFNAEYLWSLSSDLKLSWFQYVGSNIETSREFCVRMTKKRYFHESEIETILSGEIDGEKVALNKEGLPLGMTKGTNSSNFKTYRGGYNCGHQIYPISEKLVPSEIRNRFKQQAS